MRAIDAPSGSTHDSRGQFQISRKVQFHLAEQKSWHADCRQESLPMDRARHYPVKKRRMSVAPLGRALAHRNFRLFLFGQGISLIGTWMQQVAMAWLVYRLTASAFLLGLIG